MVKRQHATTLQRSLTWSASKSKPKTTQSQTALTTVTSAQRTRSFTSRAHRVVATTHCTASNLPPPRLGHTASLNRQMKASTKREREKKKHLHDSKRETQPAKKYRHQQHNVRHKHEPAQRSRIAHGRQHNEAKNWKRCHSVAQEYKHGRERVQGSLCQGERRRSFWDFEIVHRQQTLTNDFFFFSFILQ